MRRRMASLAVVLVIGALETTTGAAAASATTWRAQTTGNPNPGDSRSRYGSSYTLAIGTWA